MEQTGGRGRDKMQRLLLSRMTRCPHATHLRVVITLAVGFPPVSKAIARPDEHRTRDRAGNVDAREAIHIRMQGQTLALCNQDFERDFEGGPQFLFRTEILLLLA